MGSVNSEATHKFVIVLNEKSPIGKLLSATGQLALLLLYQAKPEQQSAMDFISFLNPNNQELISLSSLSFVTLKSTNNQLLTLYSKTRGAGVLSAIFTSTMSFNGIEENLMQKTASTPLDQVEIYGVGIFGKIEEITPLTKKFSLFK